MENCAKYAGLRVVPGVIVLILLFLSPVGAQPDGQKIESFKKIIVKAEDFYNKAVVSYEKGDSEKAEKYYIKAMQKLYQAKLGADENYKLKEEFDNLFARMDGILQEMNGTATASLEVTDEELKKIKEVEETGKVEVGRKYTIPIDPDGHLVRRYITLYNFKKRKTLQKALERSGMYRDMILGILKENNLPEELIYLPVVESLYKVNAYSPARAVGLWQFMSKTGRGFGLKINYWIDERKDPEKSTRAAVKYLAKLYEWFDDWHLALAAYNRGEAGIGRDLKFSKATDFSALQKMNAIPLETNHFVPKFVASTIIGDNCEDYGFEIDFMEPMEYDEVELNKVIDLEVIAKCINSTVRKIKKLNPALMAWCTPKNYPGYRLKLPAGTKELFQANIAKVKNLTPTRGFVKYRVRKGDVLGKIASKFHTTAYAIKRNNNIRNVNRISIGKVLKIRPGRRYFTKKKSGKKTTIAKSGKGFVNYQVKSGDILMNIAKKYSTTVSSIKKDNDIRNANRLKIGQVLMIKPGRNYRG